MTTAFVVTNGGAGAPALRRDLESVGIVVVGSSAPDAMVGDAIRCAPDLVVCYDPHPSEALFSATAALQAIAPRPVVVFTGDPDAERIGRALEAGVHVYIVSGYEPHRLRSIIHVALARFRRDRLLRDELSEIQNRFTERKLVDRAKGILMRVRNIGEDEAYRVLRTAAMQGKQRMGQLAQQVIDAARYAEAVNRAGQLRMLSQRLVKLYALSCAAVTPDLTAELCLDSIERVEGNIAALGRILSRPTFGDLLDAVTVPWGALKAALAGTPALARLPEVDRLAERLLAQAEALTHTLQTAGFASGLHVINTAGRQRMLVQRAAKQALIAGLLPSGPPHDRAATEAALADALAFLRELPLTSDEIRGLLDAAAAHWAELRPALAQADRPPARDAIARLSETLLAEFGQLTDLYERSMQMLMK